jgi:hypothetical protein
MSRPLPWSFSALNKFTTCPNQYYETKVLKNFKDESGEAALWGTYVHKCIEDFVNEDKAFPENTEAYLDQVYGVIDDDCVDIQAEIKLALSNKFEPCDWNDAWVRGIIDLLKMNTDTAWAVDWKLGKIKPDSKQLKLFALLILYHYPEVQTVHTSFEWLQFKQRTQETYTRDQIPQLWKCFIPDLTQYTRAFKTDTWQKRPSGLCNGWCPVESCQHWRPKK